MGRIAADLLIEQIVAKGASEIIRVQGSLVERASTSSSTTTRWLILSNETIYFVETDQLKGDFVRTRCAEAGIGVIRKTKADDHEGETAGSGIGDSG